MTRRNHSTTRRMALGAFVVAVLVALPGLNASVRESAFDKAYDPRTGTIRLNTDDPTGQLIFQKRDFSKDNRPAGMINLQGTIAGQAWPGTAYRPSSGYPSHSLPKT